MNRLIAALVITLVGIPTSWVANAGQANSMRCGTHIIEGGSVAAGHRRAVGKYEVLKKCGEPTERYGNTWVYDAKGERPRLLKFDRSGILIRIDN